MVIEVDTNLTYIIDSIKYLMPEVVIAITLALLVTVDLIMGKNKKLLPWLSIIGLFVTGYFIIEQFGMNIFASGISASKGMIAVDAFGAFFKGLIVTATFFVVLFSLTSSEIKQAFDRHGEYYTLIFGMVLGMFF